MKRICQLFLLVVMLANLPFFAQTAATPPSTGEIGDQSFPPPIDVLSDTMGVNFGPYLSTSVLPTVRANWYSLIPAVARAPLLKQGKVTIEFAILPNGKVAGMKLVESCGDAAMDRAAWGGITGSSPLAPLPTQFTGKSLSLRFHFYYNHTAKTIAESHLSKGPSVTTHLIALSKDTNLPQGLSTPPPSYSQRALQAGKQGEVVLSLLITKKGDVRHVAPITGFDKDLDKATRKTIKSWKFQPLIQDGKPTEEWINVRVTFSLK